MTMLFPITRTLDYRVTQNFVVSAKSFEHAAVKVGEFVEDGWDAATSLRMGVVQVSDSMEQIGNSQEFVFGDEEISGQQACVDSSIDKVVIESKAVQMYALLKKVSESPSLISTTIGDEIYEYLRVIQAKLDEPRETLLKVIAQAETVNVLAPKVARRKP